MRWVAVLFTRAPVWAVPRDGAVYAELLVKQALRQTGQRLKARFMRSFGGRAAERVAVHHDAVLPYHHGERALLAIAQAQGVVGKVDGSAGIDMLLAGLVDDGRAARA